METRQPLLVPGPSVVLPRFAPLAEILYRAFEVGALAAQKFPWPKGSNGKLLFDPYLAPHIARFWMRETLKERLNVVDEFPMQMELARALSGLSFAWRNYRLLMLKTATGGLPSASGSNPRKMHYRQEQPMLLSRMVPADASIEEQLLNLVILWNVDQHYNAVDHLLVACPKSERPERDEEGNFIASAEVHWIEPLPHPGEGEEPITAPLVGPDPSVGPLQTSDSEAGESDGS